MGQPTMEDVAVRAGVSRALVSLVMRDSPKVSKARRAAVLKAAKELGYRPNVLARNLASRRTNTIGVTVNDLHNPFFAEAVDGVLDAAEQAGYQVLLATGARTKAGEAGAIETFLRLRVDGLVLTGPRVATSKITAAVASCPVVLVARSVRSNAVDQINGDESVGAHLAVDHLVGLGHRDIAHIDGGTGAGAAARRNGYIKAMKVAGLEEHVRVAGGDFTEISGAEAARSLLGGRHAPTAIFAANDLSAVGARHQAEDMNLELPRDLSIVGYDNLALSAMRHLSLTTVNQPKEEMGRTAIELLLTRIGENRTTAVRQVVTPNLIERTSTAPPPATRRKR